MANRVVPPTEASSAPAELPETGQIVRCRTRAWLVEDLMAGGDDLAGARTVP